MADSKTAEAAPPVRSYSYTRYVLDTTTGYALGAYSGSKNLAITVLPKVLPAKTLKQISGVTLSEAIEGAEQVRTP